MTEAASHTPMDIPVRQMGFAFDDSLPKYWVGGDPFETHLFNALSLTFPKGEQEFIDSVRHYADRIRDETLAADVRAFVGQEIQHSQEHQGLNDFLTRLGLPTDYVYDFIQRRIDESNAETPPIARLAVTCALEHFTAILADAFLAEESVLDAMDDRVRPLWIWHAIEETEHKSVAFDVYQHVGGKYRTRVLCMALVTLEFIGNQSRFHRKLMEADGQGTNVASYARGMWKFWGPRGVFTRLLPDYLEYYRPDFHPWQRDNRALLDRWKTRIDASARRIVTRPAKREAA